VTSESTVPAAPPVRGTRRAVAVLGSVAAVVLVIDAVTKYLVVAMLSDRAPVRLLGGAVYLSLTRNSGAAFSLGTRITFVFPVVTVLVIGWICWMARRLRSAPWAVALGLILGGALGNLADRIFRAPGFLVGHVIDFISLFNPDARYFAIFNAADSALTCGVILAILLELTGRRRDGSRMPGQAPTGSRSDKLRGSQAPTGSRSDKLRGSGAADDADD
jgi:signal peptidase II